MAPHPRHRNEDAPAHRDTGVARLSVLPDQRSPDVARGWESKSVEAQQDAAAERRRQFPPVSREEAARRTERATVMLARTRALADLQRACAAPHRAMLEQAIADLDERLKAISD